MTYVALKETGFPRERVLGMAGILDSARMAHFIYEKLQIGAGQIRATVMGGHGDTMVPLTRFTTVAGIPIDDLITRNELKEIVEKTKNGGAEIVNLLGNGSAYYAPAKSHNRNGGCNSQGYQRRFTHVPYIFKGSLRRSMFREFPSGLLHL